MSPVVSCPLGLRRRPTPPNVERRRNEEPAQPDFPGKEDVANKFSIMDLTSPELKVGEERQKAWDSPRPKPTRSFLDEELRRALQNLDSKLSGPRGRDAPEPNRRIRMIVIGGCAAVTCLDNRPTTTEVDYFVDPRPQMLPNAKRRLNQGIQDVAKEKHYPTNWATDRASKFIPKGYEGELARKSIEQHEVLLSGKSILVCAVDWEWFLASKLKKIGDKNRDVDAFDGADALKRIMNRNEGYEMTRLHAAELRHLVQGHIGDEALDRVNKMFEHKYGRTGLVSQRKYNPDPIVKRTRLRPGYPLSKPPATAGPSGR